MNANPARALAAQTFTAAFPGWNVIAQARTPDAVTIPTAVVWTASLTRTDYAAGGLVTSAVELWLLPPADHKPGPLEDTADQMLTDAVELIEDTDGITWTTATRGSLDGQFHGWHLTLNLAHQLTKE